MVDDEQISPLWPPMEMLQAALMLGLHQRPHEVGGPTKPGLRWLSADWEHSCTECHCAVRTSILPLTANTPG